MWGYILVVIVAAAFHLAFTGYLCVGGVLAWRWPHTMWLHVAAVVWAGLNAFAGLECPLTGIERWARAHIDMAPLPASGFIDYYLTGVLYPEGAAAMMRNLVFVVVVLSWVGFLISARRRRTGGQPGARAARDEKPPADQDHGPGPDRDNVY